ncbi:CoaE-domain-containing protein [Syncephalis fuscata]|nr:CoaE-domain-containing protein [Syncephalis fuscata]
MKVVGLTGGIATGKSTVSRLLSEHYPIVDADRIAHDIVKPGQPAYRAILRHFSDVPGLVLEDGQLDRARLGQVVFGNAERRKILNQCTHPYVRRRMLWEIICCWFRGEQVVVLDVPLLIEGGLDRLVATAIVVDCPADIQLARLCSRNNMDEATAQQRIDAQLPMSTKCAHADFIVENSGSLDDLKLRVNQLVKHIQPLKLWTWLCWVPPIGLVAAIISLLWRSMIQRRKIKLE